MVTIDTIRRFGAWSLGGLLIMGGAAAIFMPGSILAGIIWLVLGLITTPVGRAAVEGAISRDIPLRLWPSLAWLCLRRAARCSRLTPPTPRTVTVW